MSHDNFKMYTDKRMTTEFHFFLNIPKLILLISGIYKHRYQ